MSEQRIRPTVILPDTSPLVHLAAADTLLVLNGLGRVTVVGCSGARGHERPGQALGARDRGMDRGRTDARRNQPVEIAATELGPLYRLALKQNVKSPRNAGEIAIAEWLADALRRIGGPALVVYESGRVPAMRARGGVAATVAVATTRNLLELAQRERMIPDADAVWSPVVRAGTGPTRPCTQRTGDRLGAWMIGALGGQRPDIATVAAGATLGYRNG